MKLTTKAVFLIFLCLFAALAVPIAVCFMPSLTLKGGHADNILASTAQPQGDPINTPGGGGGPN